MARLRGRSQAQAEGSDGKRRYATSAAGRGLIVVLDTGGIDGIAPIDEVRRARLRLLRDQADDIVLPAVVLAESVLTGHDYQVRRLLDVVSITDVDEATGHAAGSLRRSATAGGMKPPPSGVDTVVAAAADARAAHDEVLIITTDGGDFKMLGSLTTNAAQLSVLVV